MEPKRDARLRIREIRTETDPALGAAFRLLRRTFPRAELLPQRAWVRLLRERREGLWADLNWHLFVAHGRRGIVGAASGSYLGNVNVGVIGYIAVVPRARSLGIGPRLRLALQLAFERDARRIRGRPLEALVGEVHEDNPWLHRLVARRGALALDFPYYQPSLHRSAARAVPLVLYYQPLRHPRASLPTGAVRQLLYTMWRRMYRVAAPLSQPAFRRMLRALAGRERIGRRRLATRRASGPATAA
jgi:GNAT superfamily N-acetyltransferase